MPEIIDVLNEVGSTIKELRDRVDKLEGGVKDASGYDKEVIDRIQKALNSLDAIKVDHEKTKAMEASIKELEEHIALLKSTGAGASGVTPEAKAHAEAFDKYFRKNRGAESLGELQVQAGLSTSSDPDGGFTVPVEVETTIDRIATAVSTFRNLAGSMTIGTDSYTKLVNVGGATAGWVGEQDARTETDTPTLVEILINVMEEYAYPFTTQKLLDDSRIDIATWLGNEVAIEFNDQEAEAFITGNGVKQPKGILSQTMVANSSYAWGKVGFTTSGAAAALDDPDRLITFTGTLKPTYRNGAGYIMAESTQETIRTMKLGTGEYIWRPGLSEGAPNTLFGKPVAIDDFMPVIASGAFPIAYGNFKRAYLILNRQGIRVLRNPYATMGKVGFYTTRRIGGGVVNYEAYKVLKIAA